PAAGRADGGRGGDGPGGRGPDGGDLADGGLRRAGLRRGAHRSVPQPLPALLRPRVHQPDGGRRPPGAPGLTRGWRAGPQPPGASRPVAPAPGPGGTAYRRPVHDEQLQPATRVVAAGRPPREPGAPVNPPVTFTSTYLADGPVDYARVGNPTWT